MGRLTGKEFEDLRRTAADESPSPWSFPTKILASWSLTARWDCVARRFGQECMLEAQGIAHTGDVMITVPEDGERALFATTNNRPVFSPIFGLVPGATAEDLSQVELTLTELDELIEDLMDARNILGQRLGRMR